jgi:hypothetical protein
VRGSELQAASELAAEGAGGLAGQVRDLHAAIARRVFGALRVAGVAFRPVGAVAGPVRLVHDAAAAGAYGAASRVAAEGLRAIGRVAAAGAPPDAPGLDATPGGRLALGALCGVLGDRLERRGNPLAVEMSVRQNGAAVELQESGLAAAFPDATPRLAVFIHGLCENEDAWRIYSARRATYGHHLRTQLGFTPIYLRYNSGRHISENGRALAALLARLVDAWPAPVAEIALIGHSMGGLVARSACHYGQASQAVRRVRHVVSLGSPHFGANLERAAHAAAAALARVPETRPLAEGLKLRSAGITDLWAGYLTDEDWAGYDPDAFGRPAACEVPYAEHADHRFVAATLTRDPDAALGRALGDLLVTRPSAWAQPRRRPLPFAVNHYLCIGPAHHFDLLGDAAVAERLVGWLGRPRPALPAAPQRP